MKRYIRSSSNTRKGDFTVIQEVYSDGVESMISNVPPVYTMEYDVMLDEVKNAYPEQVKLALKGWTDETFNAGDDITRTTMAPYIKWTVKDDNMYSDYKKYVSEHRDEFPDPARQITVIINNPSCLPSAAEERRIQSEKLGKYLGEMLGIGR
jgi:hypothetical protein